jgi:hypothetical protein
VFTEKAQSPERVAATRRRRAREGREFGGLIVKVGSRMIDIRCAPSSSLSSLRMKEVG